MRDSDCGCTPVVEETENLKVVGVVTERDVCCGVAADDRRASEVRVAEIMRPSSSCCAADEPVEEVLRKLHEHRATSLPVVDQAGCCCGTVSSHSVERS
jgi:CBS domain-containing protein